MVQSDYTVGCDAHKHFSLFAVLDRRGNVVQRTRVGHVPDAIRVFLSQFPKGTPVALETVGNWYWIVDEIAYPGRSGQGGRRLHSPSGPRRQGQGHDGQHPQDRQARCPGVGHPTLPGQAALGLDPTSRGARREGAAPHPDGLLPAPYPS